MMMIYHVPGEEAFPAPRDGVVPYLFCHKQSRGNLILDSENRSYHISHELRMTILLSIIEIEFSIHL